MNDSEFQRAEHERVSELINRVEIYFRQKEILYEGTELQGMQSMERWQVRSAKQFLLYCRNHLLEACRSCDLSVDETFDVFRRILMLTSYVQNRGGQYIPLSGFNLKGRMVNNLGYPIFGSPNDEITLQLNSNTASLMMTIDPGAFDRDIDLVVLTCMNSLGLNWLEA
jgi:hypothetical protein